MEIDNPKMSSVQLPYRTIDSNCEGHETNPFCMLDLFPLLFFFFFEFMIIDWKMEIFKLLTIVLLCCKIRKNL